MKIIQGGVCAPKGYKANGIHCGIRRNRAKRDLALIVSETRAAAAGVYTQNLVKGAPITVTQANLADGYASAIVCNSGNANTCNFDGIEIAETMCVLVQEATDLPAEDVIVASTGVIGERLDISPIKTGMADLAAGLGDHSDFATEAIMTTDTKLKEIAVSFDIDGVECRIGGIGKGSGMINPNMATMLVFVTSDVAITPEMIKKALEEDVKSSFNMVSVDGDTSTNDTYTVMANGCAGNTVIDSEGEAFETFKSALSTVSRYLSRMIAADGEGATKLLECIVTGGKDYETAAIVAKAVISSSLVKAAMFGSDANWGRVLCAIGYCGADVDVNRVNVAFASKVGEISVCENGAGIPFSEEMAKTVLTQDEVQILVSLGTGSSAATAWGCDLTYDYVKINGDYRT